MDWTGKSSLHHRGERRKTNHTQLWWKYWKTTFSFEWWSGVQRDPRARTSPARGLTGGPAARAPSPRAAGGHLARGLRGLPGHHESCAGPAPPSALPAARGAPAARRRPPLLTSARPGARPLLLQGRAGWRARQRPGGAGRGGEAAPHPTWPPAGVRRGQRRDAAMLGRSAAARFSRDLAPRSRPAPRRRCRGRRRSVSVVGR